MGYRSQVYLGVEKSLVEDLLTFSALNKDVYQLLFEWTDKTTKTNNGNLLFAWDWIKWYRDGEIAKLEDWLNDEDRSEKYSFIRMGEEYGDVDQEGCSDEFYFYATQGIEVEFD